MSHPGGKPAPSAIILGAEAAPLRRALTPAGWATLECLVARSRPHGGGPVAEVGVREIAAEVGVSKNTAQRALTALVAAGVVEPQHRRRGPDGAFLPARYRIRLPGNALDVVNPSQTVRATRPSPSAGDTAEPAQLSLLAGP